jgi:hypothetical protein
LAQQNTVERDQSNQHDSNRHDEGEGPQVTIPGRPNHIQKMAVLPGRGRQCHGAQSDQRQSQIARRLRTPNGTGGKFFGKDLEELVNGEPEPSVLSAAIIVRWSARSVRSSARTVPLSLGAISERFMEHSCELHSALRQATIAMKGPD